jgi:hypothetical protein
MSPGLGQPSHRKQKWEADAWDESRRSGNESRAGGARNFFAIRDLIWAIYFKVEEPDKAAGPSLDTLFRRLRARTDTFEAQCRRKTAGRSTGKRAGKRARTKPAAKERTRRTQTVSRSRS